MNDMRARMLETFLAEARDLARDLEDGLRALKDADDSPELVARLFRAAHSIKGSGGMFGLAPLVSFTHVVENLLDRLRKGALEPSEVLIADLQDACDHIADLIEVLVARQSEPDAGILARDVALRAALERHDANVDSAQTAAPVAPRAADDASGATSAPVGPDCWHISIRFGEDVHRYGINPLGFLRELADLGEIVSMTTVADAMPAADAMDPEACYLGFEIDLNTDAGKSRIEDIFDFVADCSRLRILPPNSKVADFVELIREMPETDARLGAILVEAGTLTAKELDACLGAQRDQADAAGLAPALGAMVVERQLAAPAVVQAALDKQATSRSAMQAPAAMTADSAFVRVRAEQLDELVNLVGELVIAGAGASMLADRSGDAAMREAQSHVARLMEDIRDRALRMRMVPIGETFSRFHRVVRDVGRELGKDIELVIEGGDTELDKSVVEKLADPLVHLVRNAADHGLERPDARIAAGKPGRGTIRLAASHEAGQVVIEITDDGAGMNRERILAKARERGLVGANATPPDHELLQLVFEAGFSTADTVTNLSGRGVGMDVVRRNITALRGTIEMHSPAGAGTTVRIRLPLTLAIIEGFLVGVGDATYVLPLDRVVECIEMPAGAPARRGYLEVRGHALPLLRLRDQLRIDSVARTRRENVVVVECAGQRAGIVVDELLGELQTVIKPLGPLFAGLRGVSGSTILANGQVALILDIPQTVETAVSLETAAALPRELAT
ncbi:chemotaxis protein CheA [Lysobacter xanthus]